MSTPDPSAAARETIAKLYARGRPEDIARAGQLAVAFGIHDIEKPKEPPVQGLPDAPPPEAKPEPGSLADVENPQAPAFTSYRAPEEVPVSKTIEKSAKDTLGFGFQNIDPMEAGAAVRAMEEGGSGLAARATDAIAGPLSRAVHRAADVIGVNTPIYQPSATPQQYKAQPFKGSREKPVTERVQVEDPNQPGRYRTIAREKAPSAVEARTNVLAPGPVTEANRAETAAAKKAHPNVALATEFVSGLPLMAMGGGEGAVARIGEEALPAVRSAAQAMEAAKAGGMAGGAFGGASALGHNEPVVPGAVQGALAGGLTGAAAEELLSPLRGIGNTMHARLLNPGKSPDTAANMQLAEWAGAQPDVMKGLKPGPLIEAAYKRAAEQPHFPPEYFSEKQAGKDLMRGIELFARDKLEVGRRAKEVAFVHSPPQNAEPLYMRWNAELDKRTFSDGTPIPAKAAAAVKREMTKLLEKVQGTEAPGGAVESMRPPPGPREFAPQDLGAVNPTGKTEPAMQAPPQEGTTQIKIGKGRARQKRGMALDESIIPRELTAQEVEEIRAGMAAKVGDFNKVGQTDAARAMEDLYNQTRGFIEDHYPRLHEANAMAEPHIRELKSTLTALGDDPDRRFPSDPTKKAYDYNDLSSDVAHFTAQVAKYSKHGTTTEAIDHALAESPSILQEVRAHRGVRAFGELTSRHGGMTASVNSNLHPVVRLGDVGRGLATRVAGLKNVPAGGAGPRVARVVGERAGSGETREDKPTPQDVETVKAMLHAGRMAQ